MAGYFGVAGRTSLNFWQLAIDYLALPAQSGNSIIDKAARDAVFSDCITGFDYARLKKALRLGNHDFVNELVDNLRRQLRQPGHLFSPLDELL